MIKIITRQKFLFSGIVPDNETIERCVQRFLNSFICLFNIFFLSIYFLSPDANHLNT